MNLSPFIYCLYVSVIETFFYLLSFTAFCLMPFIAVSIYFSSRFCLIKFCLYFFYVQKFVTSQTYFLVHVFLPKLLPIFFELISQTILTCDCLLKTHANKLARPMGSFFGNFSYLLREVIVLDIFVLHEIFSMS